MLTSADFGTITAAIRVAADELCGGKMVVAHEGGYSEIYVPFCGLAVVESLCGLRAAARYADPFILDVGPGTDLQPHQERAVLRAAENLRIALLS